MATSVQNVELRIRSTDYSKKTTDQVVDSLKALEKAQAAQNEAAKSGAVSAGQLEQGYAKIESAAKALLGQQALIKTFEAQSAALDKTRDNLDAARKAQADYANSLDPTAEKTKKQERALATLATAVARGEKAFQTASDRVDKTGERLAKFGIDSGNVAASQAKIVSAVEMANQALARQEAAINDVDNAQRKRAAQAEAAAAQAAAVAARERQVAIDVAFANAQRDITKSLEAERQAQLAANAAAAASQHAKQYQADVVFTNAQRAAAEAIEKKTAALKAQNDAMQSAATAATRAVVNTGGVARGTAPVAGPQLQNTIRDIADPSGAALRTVAGLDAGIAALEKRVSEISGPVKDYKNALREVADVQKSLNALAGQVDGYGRQVAAVRAARTEYTAARSAVNALIAEMRSGAAGDDITTRLSRAQNVLQSAAQNMGNLTTAARANRDALSAAGVNTTNLAQAEQNLVAQAARSAQATDALTDAFKRNGAAVEKSGSQLLSFFGSGRTTLSYVQRLRGEVLSLAAGFVGINAAIGLAKGSLEAYRESQAIMSRLTIANGGDTRKAADDFKYLQEQAERIGFVFLKIAPAYAKFAIASKTAGNSTQETRYIFEQVAAASVKARLSTEEFGGVMKAFEQIISKGTVQAEELRGQLGDRLPGAFQIAAAAAGMSVEQFTKAMSLGEIGSDQVINIARQLGKTYGVANQGVAGLLEAEARFQNAADRFKTSTAEGGFVQAYSAFLAKLTALLNSGEGDKLASKLSAGFVGVIDVIKLVVDNIDTLIFAVEALVGLSFIKWLVSLPALFRLVQIEVLALNGQLLIFNGWMAKQEAAAAMSLALGAGGLTGVVARLTLALGAAVTGLMTLFPYMAAFAAAYAGTSFVLKKMDDSVREQVQASTKASAKALDDAAKAQEYYEKAKGSKDEARMKEQYDRYREIAVKAIAANAAAVKQARDKNVSLEGVSFKSLAPGARSTATEDPGTGGTPSQGALKALKKALEAEDKKSEKARRAATLKSAKEELAERLSIIDEPFQARREAAKASITDEKLYAQAIEEINKSSLKAQAAERLKFENEQSKSGESAAKKRERMTLELKEKIGAIEDDLAKRAAEGDPTVPFEARLLAREKAISNSYDQIKLKIEALRQVDPAGAKALDAQYNAAVTLREADERRLVIREEAEKLEKRFNDLLGIQKMRLDEVDTKLANGLDPDEGLQRKNDLIAQLSPGIEKAGLAAAEFAMNFQKMLDPTKFTQIITTVSAGLAKSGVDAATSANNVANAQRAMNEALADQDRQIAAINLKKSLGQKSDADAVDEINAVTMAHAQAIQFTAQALLNFVQIARDAGGLTKEQLDQMQAAANTVLTTSQAAVQQAKELDAVFASSIVQNGTTAFEALADSIAKVATGQMTLAEGFRAAARAAAQFFSGLLRDLAMAIAKQLILNAIASYGGGIGAAAVKLGGVVAGGNHNGGVVGTGTGSLSRTVSPSIFAGAQRLHSGGIPGLAPDEVPTILQRNEEVLTRDDPRHVLNGGKGGGGGGGSNRFVLVDDRSRVAEAMASAEGEQVTMVHLKRNVATIRQLLK